MQATMKEKCNNYFRPPQLSSIIRNNNILQLGDQQLDEALEKSRKYWYQLATLAYELRDSGLIPEFVNPRHALHRVPKLQPRSKRFHVRPFGTSPKPSLCLEASCTWRLPADRDCDRLEKEISHLALLQVGNDIATPFSFTADVFSSWNGIREENITGANYLGIVAIGWCYILSAQLVEMQGENASMRYTDFEAGYNNGDLPYSSKVHVVDVGEVDESVARWWSAILAQNEGWKATVKRNPKREFLAPWSGCRTCEMCLSVKHKGFSSSSVLTPLSSESAFEALVRFARLHGLHSQFPIALAMALTIPTHKYYGSSAKLPLPSTTGAKKIDSPIDVIPPVWMSLKEDLPYYMTLSCSPEVMMSTFCGAFWERDIPCNLVSPWLHPVLNEVLGGTCTMVGSDLELLAFIGAIRQPNFSALWIGAVASGLGPEILHRVRGGRPPLDPLAFPWTGCPQSFMDLPGSGPYTCDNPQYILRADVWRLMHLPSTEEDNLCYQYRPSTPWAPCGASLIKDCALRVMAHLECPRHEYKYDHWDWYREDGATIQDRGFSEQPTLAKNMIALYISMNT